MARAPKGAPAKKITMADVAAAADVSVPTVSKVLNGRSDVAPETRMRVEGQLGRSGYSRSPRRKAQPVRIIDLVSTNSARGRRRSSAAPARPRWPPAAGIAVSASPSESDVEHWLRSLAAAAPTASSWS